MGDRALSEWGSTSTAGRIAVAAVGVFSGVPFRSIPFRLAFGWGLRFCSTIPVNERITLNSFLSRQERGKRCPQIVKQALGTRPCGMATRGVVKAKGDDVM